MMTNCFYCGKEILSECDEVVIGAGKNKKGETDYLLYCVDCTETVKKLKKENEQLKQQIIDLKKCSICIHDEGFDNECEHFQNNTCENKEKWELDE